MSEGLGDILWNLTGTAPHLLTRFNSGAWADVDDRRLDPLRYRRKETLQPRGFFPQEGQLSRTYWWFTLSLKPPSRNEYRA